MHAHEHILQLALCDGGGGGCIYAVAGNHPKDDDLDVVCIYILYTSMCAILLPCVPDVYNLAVLYTSGTHGNSIYSINST